jgi:hypothetical protein
MFGPTVLDAFLELLGDGSAALDDVAVIKQVQALETLDVKPVGSSS